MQWPQHLDRVLRSGVIQLSITHGKMVDQPYIPDHPEDWLFIVSVAAIFVLWSGLDAQLAFAASAPLDYINEPDADLQFTQEQIELMNEVSARSVGFDAVADERLYCFDVRNGNVRNFRLADAIGDSGSTHVSGACFTQFPSEEVEGFLHTHPSGSDELSDEDRDIDADIRFTCLQFAEIAVSPTGSVDGLRCWEVLEKGDPAELEKVEVGVQ